jgi:endonuclease-3
VKTEDAWVDVKPEPGAKKQTATPVKRSRAKTNPVSSAVVKTPATPNNEVAVAAASDAGAPDSPYPHLQRPTPEECWAARDALAQLHSAFFRHKEEAQADGSNQLGPGNLGVAAPSADSSVLALPSGETPYTLLHGTVTKGLSNDGTREEPRRKPVLDSLVGTILSQNTTDATSAVAFANLKRAFPTWESVRVADPRPVEAAVKCGGLAEIKVRRIQVILNTLYEERGKACMEYLREMDDEAVKKELSRFKGVGPKTVSCVLMFCLKRPDFPVDTHVWKIAMTLGWIPKSATRDSAYEHLNRRVPDACKFDLHVLLVEHGKVFKNDAAWLRRAVSEQLAGAGEVGWMRALEAPGGIKHAADEHFALKSGKSVCG